MSLAVACAPCKTETKTMLVCRTTRQRSARSDQHKHGRLLANIDRALWLCFVWLVSWWFSPAIIAADLSEADVFTAGTEGYHTYRIPALIATKNGDLLAICEGRKTGRADHGDVDLVQ